MIVNRHFTSTGKREQIESRIKSELLFKVINVYRLHYRVTLERIPDTPGNTGTVKPTNNCNSVLLLFCATLLIVLKAFVISGKFKSIFKDFPPPHSHFMPLPKGVKTASV